jgi:hypothetical protein
VIERYETPMIRWGNWFGGASLLLAICGLGLTRIRASRAR